MKVQAARPLRAWVFLNLALLALLLVFGLAFDTSRATLQAPTGAAGILGALRQAGAASFIHMALGVVLAAASLINLVLALRSGIRRIQVFGALAFLSIAVAGLTGLTFIASGFQDTVLLLALIPLFLLAVLSYLLELFSLKALPQRQTG